MKYFLLIYLCACGFAFQGFAQSRYPLPGILTYQNSGNQPVVGASISASPWAHTILSNSDGTFKLEFVGKGPGYQARLTVSMEGYEVVNKRELLHTLRKDLRRPLKLYLCPKGQWEANAVAYYQINEKQITQRYREELAKVQQNLKENQQRLADSSKRLYELYRFALQQAQELAERFAIANLDDADSLYKAAFVQFTQGNIDSAIVILDDELLDLNIAKAKQQAREGNMLVDQGQLKIDSAQIAQVMLAKNYLLRYSIRQMSRRQGAKEDLERAFQLDSSHYTIRKTYADCLFPDTSSRRHFHVLLTYKQTPSEKAAIWQKIAQTYDDSLAFGQVIHALDSAYAFASIRPDSQSAILYTQITQLTYRQMGILLRKGDVEAAQDLARTFSQRPQPKAYQAGDAYAGIQSRYALSLLLEGDVKTAKQMYEVLKLQDYASPKVIAQAIADIEATRDVPPSKRRAIIRRLKKQL
ncbi:MAG: hypothetical protein AAF135_14050 [Bacteroidota bacterium]